MAIASIPLNKPSNSSILDYIAICESENNPKAKNPVSSASGRFQFIQSSWQYYGKLLWGNDWVSKDIFSWDDNTQLADFAYSISGTQPWLASSGCWSKYLSKVD